MSLGSSEQAAAEATSDKRQAPQEPVAPHLGTLQGALSAPSWRISLDLDLELEVRCRGGSGPWRGAWEKPGVPTGTGSLSGSAAP